MDGEGITEASTHTHKPSQASKKLKILTIRNSKYKHLQKHCVVKQKK